MACQSNCSKTIKYLCKEIFDIKKEFIGLKEICFDIINTNNVLQQKDKSETMEDNVEVLNNINVRNKATDYNLMENYSKATVEDPLEGKNANCNFDWKPTNKNLGHEDKPEYVLFLQKIIENQLAMQKEIQDIKTDLNKQKETCDKLQEDTQCFLQNAGTLPEIETIKADLRKLEATCDDREEDSQLFRRSVATLNGMENIKSDLEKLNKTCDKREEDTEHFRQTAASLEEKIESIGADLKKLEGACETRQKYTDTQVKTIDQKITEISAKTQTASSDGNEKLKLYTGKEDFRETCNSKVIVMIESVLRVYPESFFLFHPNCLNLDFCKELMSMNSWIHKVKNINIPKVSLLTDYLDLLLFNFDKIMAYYEENFGSYKHYNSNS